MALIATVIDYDQVCIYYYSSHQTIRIINNQAVKQFAIHAICQSVGREANPAQSCDDGMVAITETALPRCTIFNPED